MSRSRRKTPIIGVTCAESEKEDKVITNRKFRRINKYLLNQNKMLFDKTREISNNYLFAKDGKQYLEIGTEYREKAFRK